GLQLQWVLVRQRLLERQQRLERMALTKLEPAELAAAPILLFQDRPCPRLVANLDQGAAQQALRWDGRLHGTSALHSLGNGDQVRPSLLDGFQQTARSHSIARLDQRTSAPVLHGSDSPILRDRLQDFERLRSTLVRDERYCVEEARPRIGG